jgi:hypothetical protein
MGLLAVTTRAAQPLGKEQLRHRPAVRQFAREQRAQLIVVPDPLIQEIDQSVDRRLTADPFVQISTADGPDTRRVTEQPAVFKTHQIRDIRF